MVESSSHFVTQVTMLQMLRSCTRTGSGYPGQVRQGWKKVTEFIRIVLNSFFIALFPILRNLQLESDVCLYSVSCFCCF